MRESVIAEDDAEDSRREISVELMEDNITDTYVMFKIHNRTDRGLKFDLIFEDLDAVGDL
jgi:hypothetical protein